MRRNAGSVIDLGMHTVRDRDGRTHALEVCEQSGDALFHARAVEGARHFDYHERWILPVPGWTVNRFRWTEPAHFDWYVETDLISVGQDMWSVADGFIDVLVFESVRYHVQDADELAEGFAMGDISGVDVISVLKALDRLHKALTSNGFSGAELVREFAPGLVHRL